MLINQYSKSGYPTGTTIHHFDRETVQLLYTLLCTAQTPLNSSRIKSLITPCSASMLDGPVTSAGGGGEQVTYRQAGKVVGVGYLNPEPFFSQGNRWGQERFWGVHGAGTNQAKTNQQLPAGPFLWRVWSFFVEKVVPCPSRIYTRSSTFHGSSKSNSTVVLKLLWSF